MIVSHRHRFIFIHCRKVAGSSMKVTLAPYLGPSDILMGREVLSHARFLEPWVLREFMTAEGVHQIVRSMLRGKSWRDALNKTIKKRHKRAHDLRSSAHPPAVDVREAFPDEWSEYFKFCFVRNPYERAVSDYLYLTRKFSNPPPFSDYLRELSRTGRDFHGRTKHDNWPMYTIDGEVAMDFVGRYENLHDDFRIAMQRIGLPDVAMTGSEKRRDYTRPWRDYYQPGDRERVEALYGSEIEMFGYEFGEPAE